MTVRRGRNFLHSPGPSNVPERVLREMHRGSIDLVEPELLEATKSSIEDLKTVFGTESGEVFTYISNGHGAWEAGIVNILSPGDKVLIPGSGHFSTSWTKMTECFGVEVANTDTDWRAAIDVEKMEAALKSDKGGRIKAVMAVHTDTATSATSDVKAIREAIDRVGHPALLVVDAVASLAVTPLPMEDWGIDLVIGASQKALMMPPGLSFNAVGPKALEAAKSATLPRNYWDWQIRMANAHYRYFCGTTPEQQIFGLREALTMIKEEGMDGIYRRHQRLADATRAAIDVWAEGGIIECNVTDPGERSNSVTTVRMNDGYDPDQFRVLLREDLNVSVAGGLGELQGKAFRIGHLGDLNEPMILGTLASIELGLQMMQVPHGKGGAEAAIAALSG